MARVIEVIYDKGIVVPELSEKDLETRAAFWAETLSKPEIGLMKPTATADDVILEHPERRRAHSLFQVVYYLVWSRSNPDFTEDSRTADLSKVKRDVLRLAGKEFHPELTSLIYGINLWMDRLPDAAFAAGTPDLWKK